MVDRKRSELIPNVSWVPGGEEKEGGEILGREHVVVEGFWEGVVVIFEIVWKSG